MPEPAAEIDVDEDLIRRLLGAQRPALASLPIEIVGNGWDNVIARLGDDFVVRLPRRQASAELVEHEQRWLPVIGPRLPLPTPIPLFAGHPESIYPWAWSICPWLPGAPTSLVAPDDLHEAARTLAAFVKALHQPAPADVPLNPFRGVQLRERADAVHRRAHALADVIEANDVITTWEDLHATPPWLGPALWLHGDLHPSNMLTNKGRLAAVVDFGDITGGDPATDLAVAWMLFDEQERATFRDAAGIDDDTWRRAAGWALNLSLAYLTGDDTTSMPAIGRATLAAVLAEFG
jgi:aminoglycoside phosphotransferase (APT) family kinase protein